MGKQVVVITSTPFPSASCDHAFLCSFFSSALNFFSAPSMPWFIPPFRGPANRRSENAGLFSMQDMMRERRMGLADTGGGSNQPARRPPYQRQHQRSRPARHDQPQRHQLVSARNTSWTQCVVAKSASRQRPLTLRYDTPLRAIATPTHGQNKKTEGLWRSSNQQRKKNRLLFRSLSLSWLLVL